MRKKIIKLMLGILCIFIAFEMLFFVIVVKDKDTNKLLADTNIYMGVSNFSTGCSKANEIVHTTNRLGIAIIRKPLFLAYDYCQILFIKDEYSALGLRGSLGTMLNKNIFFSIGGVVNMENNDNSNQSKFTKEILTTGDKFSLQNNQVIMNIQNNDFEFTRTLTGPYKDDSDKGKISKVGFAILKTDREGAFSEIVPDMYHLEYGLYNEKNPKFKLSNIISGANILVNMDKEIYLISGKNYRLQLKNPDGTIIIKPIVQENNKVCLLFSNRISYEDVYFSDLLINDTCTN